MVRNAPAVLAAALVLIALLAGCADTAEPRSAGGGIEDHMPDDAVLGADFEPMPRNRSTKTTLDTYGLAQNPGPASSDPFGNADGMQPDEVRGGIWVRASDGDRQVYAFAFAFADAAAADRYLEGRTFCDNAGPLRHLLQDARFVVQFVGVALDGAQDAALEAAVQAAVEDVRDRTGARDACA